MSGWWHRATTEQRLAQIDAAIELGMTARQTAMNCGCLTVDDRTGGGLVGNFANHHNRHFNGESVGKRKPVSRIKRWVNGRPVRAYELAKHQYLSGEPVDFWGTE